MRCPKCGHIFSVEILRENPKGAGAHYSRDLKKLSETHERILFVLYNNGPMPKRRISKILHDMGYVITGNELSGRLSELAGAGYAKFEKVSVRVLDEEAKQFRFERLPVWSITEKGRQYIENKLGLRK